MPDQAPTRSQPGQRNARRRPRRLGLILLIGLPLVVAGAAIYYWVFMRPYESTDDAFIEANVVPIASRVPGQVAQLQVGDNQAVKQGEVLLLIDPRDYEARLAQTQAVQAAAETRLEQAKAQLASDRARVEQERANVGAAEVEAQRAEADLKRYQSLQSPAVSRSQLDLAAAQARSNQAAVLVARGRVRAAEAQVSLGQAGIEAAQAEIQRAQAGVRQAELELSYTKVLAPENGFVTHRTVEAGAYVQAGQALLALVPSRVWVVANFKETQLTHMRPGQPVSVHVDAYPGHRFRAHVDSIQRGSGARFSVLPPENASGNYVKVVQRVPVKIVFDEPPDATLPLGPGMSVQPKVNILAKGPPDQGSSAQPAEWTVR
jgi:membrane fusion protein, multidrug efflux system